MGILIKNAIMIFSETQRQKKTPLSLKKSNTFIRRPQIKKFYKTDPPKKSKNLDSKKQYYCNEEGAAGPKRPLWPEGPPEGPKGP